MPRSKLLSVRPSWSQSSCRAVFQVPTLRSLAAVIDARDYATHEHSCSVARIAEQIGMALELPPDDMQQLCSAALLHDIGKVGLPDTILLKPGPLDADELSRMREHPIIGERIVAPILPNLAMLIRSHHEWWNGSGYPDGLATEAIPLLSRIISVADAFDAMTTDRPYRAALSHAAALDFLRAGGGIQWDALIVDVFMTLATPTVPARRSMKTMPRCP